MGFFDFLRDVVIPEVAGDKDWDASYSADGKALNMTKGDDVKVTVRPSDSTGTATDVEIANASWKHVE